MAWSTVCAGTGYDAVVMPELMARQVLPLLVHRRSRVRLGWIGVTPRLWWWPVPPGSDEGLAWPQDCYLPAGTVLPLSISGHSVPPFVWLRRDEREPFTHPVVLSAVLSHVARTAPAASGRAR
ncbi:MULTISPECIES: hypothetical protein [Streptomyces]|uniref:Uncharacterized protein n=1 Tax=Streptomyces aidingensis TaxID=910347 RepID=A0A1I1U8V8_9ACTN|nr:MULTISPECIES: hypothetical protein [Streptomyces]SFD65163.1 hypothetical protein SAMN05421773_12262 [Streptomyces aidingensis]